MKKRTIWQNNVLNCFTYYNNGDYHVIRLTPVIPYADFKAFIFSRYIIVAFGYRCNNSKIITTWNSYTILRNADVDPYEFKNQQSYFDIKLLDPWDSYNLIGYTHNNTTISIEPWYDD